MYRYIFIQTIASFYDECTTVEKQETGSKK